MVKHSAMLKGSIKYSIGNNLSEIKWRIEYDQRKDEFKSIIEMDGTKFKEIYPTFEDSLDGLNKQIGKFLKFQYHGG